MHAINLKVEDSFYPHFKAMLESFIKDKKIEIISSDFPEEIIMNDIEEIRQSVYVSEKTVGVNQKEYQKEMDDFFKRELGINR